MIDSTPDMDRRARRNRLLLLGLFAIAFLPLAASHLLYLTLRGEQPWATTNHGELLQPPVPVTTLSLRGPGGQPDRAIDGRSGWWLLLTTAEDCASECEQAAFMLRQLHVLLHRDAPRVQRGIVFNPQLPGEIRWQDLAERYAPLTPFSTGEATLREGIYIVDPLGNLMLFYPYSDAGKPVLEDLKRLLKVSQRG
jgi:hypothetical protein